MIYITAQPDELYFVWQLQIQLENFKSLGIDLKTVHHLVGIKENTSDSFIQLAKEYPEANFHFYKDERKSFKYIPSIRPHLLSKFYNEFPEYGTGYAFYLDADVILTDIPPFEGMEDGRWHISPADYISYDYIKEKNSPSMLRHMLDSVGIDEETVKAKGKNVGGVQYFLTNVSGMFWSKVEQDCERMWTTYHNNFNLYSQEFEQHFNRPLTGDDFQIWCVDMWCVYWNALLMAIPVYVNPLLKFVWPCDPLNDCNDLYIFHNAGINQNMKNEFFWKEEFKNSIPFDKVPLETLGFARIVTDNGTEIIEPKAQRKYIEIMQNIRDKNTSIKVMPTVSCVMTTYGRFECVERSIAFFLNQDYPFKELVILNTAPIPLILGEELYNKGIRIINNQYIIGTDSLYTNVGQIRSDALLLAHGDLYICWDDDDMYLPYHISKGVEHLLKSGKKAWMPAQSIWTPDGGNTFEYARNSMEASVIADIKVIREYGFYDSNGAEHLTWRRGLVQEGELDEDFEVTPFESYVYIWGENIAQHKQSGTINNPNNFEEHKQASTDFGNRPLGFYDKDKLSTWYKRINNFINNEEVSKLLEPYII